MTRRYFILALMVLAAALVLSACGGGGGAAQTVALEATDFAFSPNTATVTAGSVTFNISNKGALEHNFAILDAAGAEVSRINSIAVGGTQSVTANLAAGTYTFVCDVPGHHEQGMEGTLTVNP
ncbi:MAG TPA: cupredoxin domain-containing protein [Anaerolineae bacterium]|nr:cupredoxin domain-containing protein [Anaerolineae bacterium]